MEKNVNYAQFRLIWGWGRRDCQFNVNCHRCRANTRWRLVFGVGGMATVSLTFTVNECRFVQVSVTSAGGEDKKLAFRTLLVTRCQMEFEKQSVDETTRNTKVKEIEECADPVSFSLVFFFWFFFPINFARLGKEKRTAIRAGRVGQTRPNEIGRVHSIYRRTVQATNADGEYNASLFANVARKQGRGEFGVFVQTVDHRRQGIGIESGRTRFHIQ